MITLHEFARSSASFRVRITLNLKGIKYQSVSHDLTQGDHRDASYLAINPQGLLPAIEHNGQVVTQSLAIMEYLDEVFPSPALLPFGNAERAWVRSLSQMIASDTHAFTSMRASAYLEGHMHQTDTEVRQWQHHWLHHTFSAFEERLLGRREAGRFCYSEGPGLADIVLVPQVAAAQRLSFPTADYSTISQIVRDCMSIPAFIRAAPTELTQQ